MLNIIHRNIRTLRQLGADEKGASAVEYAILVGIVGAAIATGAQAFGDGLSGVFSGLLATVGLS